jgi:ribose transport system ATP-binding protein
MAKILTMEGITKSFFGVSVLKEVDFDLESGEVHALLGENGAGKSTLMKILSGAYQADSGSITLDSKKPDLTTYDPKTAEDLGIVTVYQNFHLIPHLSVAENLAMPLFTHGKGVIRWNEVYDHARLVLEKIDYEIDLRTKVRDLPVSQKQMLEIAIALSKNARVLIMDEPTAALSGKETEILFEAIADIKTRGIGIIYISHKLEEVKQIADRITVLRDGARIATLATKDAELDEIVRLMIGKELSRNEAARKLSFDGDLFRVEGLKSATFSAPTSFAVRKGEILGVTGLVGSGKTELARALFGIDRLSEGTVSLGGQVVSIDSPQTAVQLGLGYLPEDRDACGLCLNLGVKENISIVLLSKLKGLLFNTATEKRTVSRVVESTGVRAAGLAQQVKYLSGGNKQKVVFGKWISAGCKLLILDEPTIGIDVGARGEIYHLIREFVAEDEDRAVLFISSDMAEILEVADRILVMAGGSLVAELDPKRATKQEIMEYCLRVRRAEE